MQNSQLAASVFREDAYKSKLTAVKNDLVKAHDERANLRWPVNNLVAKLQEASADFGGAIQLVSESSN